MDTVPDTASASSTTSMDTVSETASTSSTTTMDTLGVSTFCLDGIIFFLLFLHEHVFSNIDLNFQGYLSETTERKSN